MDIKRFEKSPTGRLIMKGDGNARYSAFVPNALPPDYTPSRSVTYELSKADRALGELAGLSNMLPNPTLLVRPFIRREAVLSSRIEGTQAGIEDLYRYEIRQTSPTNDVNALPLNDIQEVHNYVRALEYGVERLKIFPLSLGFIRELHELLMEKVRGEYATPGQFRRSQNWIGRAGSTLTSATYVPPPVEEMQQTLSALELYIHMEEDVPPLIRLAFIHYQFEAIHPFIDGNGRIGRLLITLLLIYWNILPTPLLYISAYFEKNRDDYYRHLLSISVEGTWDDWIYFFIMGVTEQATNGILRARQIQALQSRWTSILEKEKLSVLTVSICNYLLEQPIVTAVAIRDRFDIPQQSALRILKRLVDLGIVTLSGTTERNQQFSAVELLNIYTRE